MSLVDTTTGEMEPTTLDIDHGEVVRAETASRLRHAIAEVQRLQASLRHEIGSTRFDDLMNEARGALDLAEAKLCAAFHEDNSERAS